MEHTNWNAEGQLQPYWPVAPNWPPAQPGYPSNMPAVVVIQHPPSDLDQLAMAAKSGPSTPRRGPRSYSPFAWGFGVGLGWICATALVAFLVAFPLAFFSAWNQSTAVQNQPTVSAKRDAGPTTEELIATMEKTSAELQPATPAAPVQVNPGHESGTHYVRGYTRKDGTRVSGYYRR